MEPVDAYSTLGWFDDPLLSSMLDGPDFDLAGVIFHELAHRVLAFKAGRLVEAGPPGVLARSDGEYARLRRAVETELG